MLAIHLLIIVQFSAFNSSCYRVNDKSYREDLHYPKWLCSRCNSTLKHTAWRNTTWKSFKENGQQKDYWFVCLTHYKRIQTDPNNRMWKLNPKGHFKETSELAVNRVRYVGVFLTKRSRSYLTPSPKFFVVDKNVAYMLIFFFQSHFPSTFSLP